MSKYDEGWPIFGVSKDLGVTVTGHSMIRWRERYPDSDRHTNTVRGMAYQVKGALDAGRMSKRKPAWVTLVVRSKHAKEDGPKWWIWPEDESCAMVVTVPRISEYAEPEKAAGFKRRYLVVTVVPRQDSSEQNLETAHYARQHHADRMRRMKSGQWDRAKKRRRRG